MSESVAYYNYIIARTLCKMRVADQLLDVAHLAIYLIGSQGARRGGGGSKTQLTAGLRRGYRYSFCQNLAWEAIFLSYRHTHTHTVRSTVVVIRGETVDF